MEFSQVEKLILRRFQEKCHLAGGARPGFHLRKQAILFIQDRHPGLDFEEGLQSLTEKGVLQPNEAGDRFYLTEAGVGEIQNLAA